MLPVSPIIHSRPMVGVEKRVRTIVGMPPTMAITVPITPTSRVIHENDGPSNRKTDPATRVTVPIADHRRGTPACTSMP